MKFFLLLILISCASHLPPQKKVTSHVVGKSSFDFTDETGRYRAERQTKIENAKLMTRVKLFSKNDMRELESSVTISRIGHLKGSGRKPTRSILPEISQFKVWLEKKQYTSQVKIIPQKRLAEVTSVNAKGELAGLNIKLPKGKYFCYYSQLPECLILQNLLFLSAKKKINLYVIWDSFPYHQEVYKGLSNKLYSPATISLSRSHKKELIYNLEVENQILFYHFNSDFHFVKQFWISQGMSMIKTLP